MSEVAGSTGHPPFRIPDATAEGDGNFRASRRGWSASGRRRLLINEMKDDLPRARAAAMLEEEDAQISAEHLLPAFIKMLKRLQFHLEKARRADRAG
jgi:hypothetical protein